MSRALTLTGAGCFYLAMLHQYRLCAAFTGGVVSACARPKRGSTSKIVSMYRQHVSVRRPFARSMASAGSAAAKVENEVTGVSAVEERGGSLSPEERAAVRAERKKRREVARQARILSVGRAKSVRRVGSPTESTGLEALFPPQGAPGSGAPALSGLPNLRKPFKVLGIETSCDDTAAAVVRSDGEVLGEAIAGQAEVHEKWGGVVPGLARDSHQAKMDGVVERALREAGMSSAAEVDAVAVTVGPGLEICLRVGCEKAKNLATEYGKPFVAVHHLEAHALLARKTFPPSLEQATLPPTLDETPAATATAAGAAGGSASTGAAAAGDSSSPPAFPFLGLLVSGGHCQLLVCEGVGLYTVLGGTVDDALGEAYDKAARLLGLKVGGGGGPAVEALALKGDPKAVALSVPMQARKDCDFSFAGLKNSFRLAVSRAVEEWALEQGGAEEGDEARETMVEAGEVSAAASIESRGAALPESTRADLAASFQNTAIRHLEERLRRAMGVFEETMPLPGEDKDDGVEQGDGGALHGGTRTLAVVGGVAANQELRRRLQALCESRQPAWRMVVPPARLCTDNGVMVAWAAVERLRRGMSNTAEDQMVYARLPLGRANGGGGADDVVVGKHGAAKNWKF